MSYIGNTSSVQQYAPQVAYFSGDASTVAFTLPVSVVSAAQIIVAVANVIQNPSSAFTVNGTTLTFTSAPPSGTNNIWVQYTTLQTNIVQPAAASVGLTQLSATGTPSSSNYLRGDNSWAALTSSQWTTSSSNIYYNTGNVGVNTSTPGNYGNLAITGNGSTNSVLFVGNTQADGAQTPANSGLMFGRGSSTGWGQAAIWPIGAGGFLGSLAFATTVGGGGGGSFEMTERMRVVSTGGVRFMCENFANIPSSTNWGVEIHNTGSGSRFFGQGTGTETHIEFGNRNGTRGSIQTTSGGTSYNTTSDYRLKENITPMTGALEKVGQLNPVTYNWKVGGSGQGFIAHELQAVVPDAVTGEKDAVDENDEPKYQMVDTSFLVATLTAAIQEQQALIESLTARITALESK